MDQEEKGGQSGARLTLLRKMLTDVDEPETSLRFDMAEIAGVQEKGSDD